MEQRSAVAKHIVEKGHNITEKDLTVIKEVTDWRKLEAYESFCISQEDPEDLMNTDKGFGYSPLFEKLKIKGFIGKQQAVIRSNDGHASRGVTC